MSDLSQHARDTEAFSFGQVRANDLSFRVAMAGGGERLVLCLHGFPESAISWRHQMQPLAQAGYRVWAPDLRGYGETTRPAGIEAYSIESLMEDVNGLLDAAQVKRAILLGHDWGGIVAWYYAMRNSSRVEALVIMNAPHPACFEREIRRWRQLHRSWYMAFFQIPRLPELALSARRGYVIGEIFERMAMDRTHMPNDVVEGYRQWACKPDALTAMINYYRAAIRGRGAWRQRRLGYQKITIPTLVIWGLQDQALVAQNLDGLSEWVNDLTVVMMADAGHFVHEDKPATGDASSSDLASSRISSSESVILRLCGQSSGWGVASIITSWPRGWKREISSPFSVCRGVPPIKAIRSANPFLQPSCSIYSETDCPMTHPE